MKLAFNPRSIPLNTDVNVQTLHRDGYKLAFKLVVIVVLNCDNKDLSFSLAIAEIPANQMDHDKSSL
jgi:hypothetical protein